MSKRKPKRSSVWVVEWRETDLDEYVPVRREWFDSVDGAIACIRRREKVKSSRHYRAARYDREKERKPMTEPPKGLDEREQMIYWLLRAYDSGHREGWEPGPSVSDTMKGMHGFLCNLGYDPNLSRKALARHVRTLEEAMTDSPTLREIERAGVVLAEEIRVGCTMPRVFSALSDIRSIILALSKLPLVEALVKAAQDSRTSEDILTAEWRASFSLRAASVLSAHWPQGDIHAASALGEPSK